MKQTFSINLSIWSYIFVVFVLLSGCKNTDEINPAPSVLSQNEPDRKEGSIILGKKLENPYTVQVMKQAYSNLLQKQSSGRISAVSPVFTTHYYVRFLPKDWTEYDRLKADDALKLYDIPLDYEIELNGNHYHDPSVPEDKPTWQYTSVKKDYVFPEGISYQILDELYLPEQDAPFLQQSSSMRVAGKSLVDALVDEAMILTRNFADTVKTVSTPGGRTQHTPWGFVKVYDNRLGQLIPLVGIRMRARRWFDIRETFTNRDGYYQLSDFRRPCNYALFFETDDFDVRSGTFGQAWINGPKQSDPWHVDMWDGINRFYSHVFRGAWRYHYGEIGGLRRPTGSGKIKYGAFDKEGGGQHTVGILGINPEISVYRYYNGNGVEWYSDEVFSVTVHETAHHTHRAQMNSGLVQYVQVSDYIKESWPVAVQWFITSMEYRERGIPTYASHTYDTNASFPIAYGYQYWNRSLHGTYTSLFIDIVDDFNQNGTSFSGIISGQEIVSTINDQVTGYTLAGIETYSLKHIYGLSSLRDQLIKYKPENVSVEQIDELLLNF